MKAAAAAHQLRRVLPGRGCLRLSPRGMRSNTLLGCSIRRDPHPPRRHYHSSRSDAVPSHREPRDREPATRERDGVPRGHAGALPPPPQPAAGGGGSAALPPPPAAKQLEPVIDRMKVKTLGLAAAWRRISGASAALLLRAEQQADLKTKAALCLVACVRAGSSETAIKS